MRLLMLGSHTVDFDRGIVNTLSEFPTSSSFVRWIAVYDKLFPYLDGLLLPACPPLLLTIIGVGCGRADYGGFQARTHRLIGLWVGYNRFKAAE
jgi:hypothetical protein